MKALDWLSARLALPTPMRIKRAKLLRARPCVVCQERFRPAASKKPRVTCSRKCAMSLAWKNPEARARRVASIAASKNTPEAQAALAAHNQRRWAKPEEHAKLSEQNRRQWADPKSRAKRAASIKAANSTPQKRAFYSKLRTEQWTDEVFRSKTVAGIRASKGSPEARALFSTLLRERWADPVMRAKYTAANAARNNPEHRERNRQMMLKRWREDDTFRALCAASMEFYWSQPGVREHHSAMLKALWADPVWRMKQRNRVADGMKHLGTPLAAAAAAAAEIDTAADLMQAVDAVVPKALSDFARADICQDLMLALLEGTLKLRDLKSGAKAYLGSYYKMYPDKFGPISLDAPIPGTDGLTIMDRLSNESAHF